MISIVLAALVAMHPALDDSTQVRLLGLWPQIEAAAHIADVEPDVIAAIVVTESRGHANTYNIGSGAEGPGQVIWGYHRSHLEACGLTRADLQDPIFGVLAIGAVLRYIREEHGTGGEGTLCAYAKGNEGIGDDECVSSRMHMAIAGDVRAGGV